MEIQVSLKIDGDENEVKDYVFTFCGDHEHKNRYVVIHGTFFGAREKMIELHSIKWAFQYNSKEDAGVDRWGLTELS